MKRQHATRLRQIERALDEIDAAIAALVASDPGLARKAEIVCSIPGVSMVTAAAILAEMPELGTLEAATAASLTGLAPFTRESGQWKGQAKIGGGRGELRRARLTCQPFRRALQPGQASTTVPRKGQPGLAMPRRSHQIERRESP